MSIYEIKNQCTVWEFRANENYFKDTEDAIGFFRKLSKKFVFQLEQGEQNEYKHWQGRLSLWKIKRGSELAKLILGFRDDLPNYLQPTALANYKNEAFYCMKEDTRLLGPFKDTDTEKTMTTQLDIFLRLELRGYQKDILTWGNTFDMRSIDVIYDPVGNLGKSLFIEYLEYIGLAEDVPPYRLMDDIFQWVASRPIKKMYTFDMPRGMKKDKLADFYSGIEVIKNGVAFDKRYKGHKIRFTRPRIVVFTNHLPAFELMSADRWNVWEVRPDYDLMEYVEENKKTITKYVKVKKAKSKVKGPIDEFI